MRKYNSNLPELKLEQARVISEDAINHRQCWDDGYPMVPWELTLERGCVHNLTELHDYLKMHSVAERYIVDTKFNHLQIKNLIGFNFETFNLRLFQNPCLISLEGLETRKELGSLEINSCRQYNNLHDIHKHLPRGIQTLRFSDQVITGNMLGLLLLNVEHLQINENSGTVFTAQHSKLSVVTRTIKRHWRNGRDILECQEELITDGYKEYAKL